MKTKLPPAEKMRRACMRLDEATTGLLRAAANMPKEVGTWDAEQAQMTLLNKAREYTGALNALTRIRK